MCTLKSLEVINCVTTDGRGLIATRGVEVGVEEAVGVGVGVGQ